MKIYCATNQLRMVGKAWEIRTKLNQLTKSELTVSEWLTRVTNPRRLPRTPR